MSNRSRIATSQSNFIFSLINNFVITILGFVTRTIFVHTLGADYLGLNGLFTNVLSLLSLAELGIGSAITFSLYKPIAENDDEKIKSLMRLYEKSYKVIGTFILCIGLAITPVLKFIVNLDPGIEINYYIIYLMFLFNTVVSYWFFAYRSVILYANQEAYVITKVETVFNLIRNLLQFLALILFRSYYLYLSLPIIGGILKNLIISRVAGLHYPIINERTVSPLEKSEKRAIFQNVFALSLFKISGVVYGATDNLIISAYLGTKLVGITSNYFMIIQLVTTYINMLFQSMYAGIGNLNATETIEYKYTTFKRLDLLNFWIYCYASICLGCFLNPFINLWLGSEYRIQSSTVIILTVVFLVPGLNNIINIYKDACGLFKDVQFRALLTAFVNIVTSIVLVQSVGLDGVYIGTIIAYLTTIYIVDPKVVFKKVFEKNHDEYYRNLFKKIGLFVALFSVLYFIVSRLNINSWFSLLFIFILTSVVINSTLLLIYMSSPEFIFIKQTIYKTLTQHFKRRT